MFGCRTPKEITEEEVSAAIAECDVDASGNIDKDELSAYIIKLNKTFQEDRK